MSCVYIGNTCIEITPSPKKLLESKNVLHTSTLKLLTYYILFLSKRNVLNGGLVSRYLTDFEIDLF